MLNSKNFNLKMPNQEIAKIFRNMAFYLEMEGVAFKPSASGRAPHVLGGL